MTLATLLDWACCVFLIASRQLYLPFPLDEFVQFCGFWSFVGGEVKTARFAIGCFVVSVKDQVCDFSLFTWFEDFSAGVHTGFLVDVLAVDVESWNEFFHELSFHALYEEGGERLACLFLCVCYSFCLRGVRLFVV